MIFSLPLPPHLLQPPDGAPPFLSFRSARARDRVPLYNACYPHYARSDFVDTFRRVLLEQEAGRAIQLVVEAGGEGLIGSGRLVRYTPVRAEIAELAIAVAWRGRGVGSALIRIMIRITQAAGFECLEIGVTGDNRRAHALYRRLGFTPLRVLSLPTGGQAQILVREFPQT